MIFEERKLIFLHVQKTGGNSIQTLLEPFSDDRKRVGLHHDGFDRFDISGPVTFSKHDKLMDYAGRIDIRPYRVAITCRHPLDRLVSNYFSPHRWFVEEEGRWVWTEPYWDRCKLLGNPVFREPIVSWLEVDGAIRTPDFLIRYEDLQKSFDRFVGAIDLPINATLPNINTSRAAPSEIQRARSDPFLIEFTREHFQKDFEVFGYTLD